MPTADNEATDDPEIIRRSVLKATGATVGGSIALMGEVDPAEASKEEGTWNYLTDVHFVELGYVFEGDLEPDIESIPLCRYEIDKLASEMKFYYSDEELENKLEENDAVAKSNEFHPIPANIKQTNSKSTIVKSRNKRLLPIQSRSVAERYKRPNISVNTKGPKAVIKADGKNQEVDKDEHEEMRLDKKEVRDIKKPNKNKNKNYKVRQGDKKRKRRSSESARKNRGDSVVVTPVISIKNHGVLEVYTRGDE